MQEIKKEGKKFVTPYQDNTKRRLLDLLLWKLGYYYEPLARVPLPKNFKYPLPTKPLTAHKPYVVWLGHATTLISLNGFNILTDPHFSSFCSPLPILSLKRKAPPALSLQELPPIDCVLISHNHYDHLDEKSIKGLFALNPRIKWIVPLGLKKWLEKRGLLSITELKWWEKIVLPSNIAITCVPSQHYSSRSPIDFNNTLWGGFVIEGKGRKIYFCGDSGYNEKLFQEIGTKWQGMDLSLIPIGSYLPRPFMGKVHINPEEAVKVHQKVLSNFSLAIHWGTFRLSDEPMARPPYDLFLAMQKAGLPFNKFIAPNNGLYFNF